MVGRSFHRAYSRRNRSEEHTSEFQSQSNLVCRLLLEKKNTLTWAPTPRPSPTASADRSVQIYPMPPRTQRPFHLHLEAYGLRLAFTPDWIVILDSTRHQQHTLTPRSP